MKKTLPMRVLSFVLCAAMLATVTPIFAAAETAAYLGYNATTGAVDTACEADNVNVIDEATDAFVTGWNIVKGNVEFEDRITLPADVNLILANGATLTADLGIAVAVDGDFAVYAQSNDAAIMGKLIVPANEDSYDAGIGCSENSDCGSIAIYGGMLTVQGGNSGAGIGGGFGSKCGNITIAGGVITATGGNSGAGIGGGFNSECGDITITGGVVTATGGDRGAGIGNGAYGTCSVVTISGGVVTAQGGESGAGIGGGFGASCAKVTVSGGYIQATAGTQAESIGAGFTGTIGEVSIDPSCVSVTKGGSQYINYEPVAAVNATCTTTGCAAYVIDHLNALYYTAFPFTADGLIGDSAALAKWKEEGAGCVPRLPHTDADEDDECDVCGAVRTVYLDYNETAGKVDTERELWNINVINEAAGLLIPGWNVVKGDVTFEDRLEFLGNVNLILANGATLTAKKGITVSSGGDVAIYAQSNDKATMGKLVVPGADDYHAGIGDPGAGVSCGSIAIYGGMVTVQGGWNGAGIGSGAPSSTCGDITIRGGIVTATGGPGAAGIGSGRSNCSCDNITISGGIVTATGGYEAAGIGSGNYRSSCGTVTVSGGYVKATAGDDAVAIGAGYESYCKAVSIDKSLTSVKDGDTQYINYHIPALGPTCTESGFPAYYIDPLSNTYYTAISFAEDKLIGDATALAAWKVEGGGGYIAPLGHDWQFVDEDTHQCARCETTAEHTGADDFICDDCGGILLETAIAVTKAKGEAKAALTEAVGENPSDELAAILSDACAAVDAATTLDGVASAKEQGLSDIEAQKETELETVKAQILSECEMILAMEEFSDKVKTFACDFMEALNAAKTLQEIDRAEGIFVPLINLQVARDDWTAELETLLPEEPSDAVAAIIGNAKELILSGADTAVFDDVFAIARQAVERQLAVEAATEAMEALLEQATDDLATANDTITALNDTIADKEATITEKLAALDTATAQLNATKEALDAAQADLETAKANIKELEGTVNEKDAALAQAAKDLEDKQAALDEMAENYNEAKSALDKATKALDEARAANEQATKDLAAANEALKTANDTIAALNDTIADKDATIAEKQEAVEAAQKALDEAKAKVGELEGTVSEKDEALQQAEQEIQDLQAEIDRLKALLDDGPTEPQPTETRSDEGMLGDANGDGAVNMKDVLLMRKYLADMDVEYNARNADVNGDGAVNMKDVLTMRKFLAEVIDVLGA